MSKFNIRVNVTLKESVLLPNEDSPQFIDAVKEYLENRLNDCGLVSDAHIIEIIKEEKKLSLKESQKAIDEESAKLREDLKGFTKSPF